MPRIAAFGAASRIAVAAARQSAPASPSQRPPPPAPDPSFSVIAASGWRERMSRSGLSTATDAASIPPDDGDPDALRADHALGADRESRGEVAGVRVEEVDRELLAEHQPEHAREHPEHDRVEHQHSDHGPRRVAVAAQVRDQPPALGHVSSIALNANRKPTSAEISANSAVDWLVAAAARANSFSS